MNQRTILVAPKGFGCFPGEAVLGGLARVALATWLLVKLC